MRSNSPSSLRSSYQFHWVSQPLFCSTTCSNSAVGVSLSSCKFNSWVFLKGYVKGSQLARIPIGFTSCKDSEASRIPQVARIIGCALCMLYTHTLALDTCMLQVLKDRPQVCHLVPFVDTWQPRVLWVQGHGIGSVELFLLSFEALIKIGYG